MGDIKIISYDPAVYKLVPIEPDGDMYRAAGKIDDECFSGGNAHGASDEQIWNAMIEAVPDDLPGVVETDAAAIRALDRQAILNEVSK